jgi:hypothetical protein
VEPEVGGSRPPSCTNDFNALLELKPFVLVATRFRVTNRVTRHTNVGREAHLGFIGSQPEEQVAPIPGRTRAERLRRMGPLRAEAAHGSLRLSPVLSPDIRNRRLS